MVNLMNPKIRIIEDTCCKAKSHLEGGGREDLSSAIALGLEVTVHLKPLDGALSAGVGDSLEAAFGALRIHGVV